eukprot:14305654-Alexandrium_andersonii.AAC.1
MPHAASGRPGSRGPGRGCGPSPPCGKSSASTCIAASAGAPSRTPPPHTGACPCGSSALCCGRSAGSPRG